MIIETPALYRLIEVSHDIQVAHRLTMLPGKCQNIHGHSMHVTMQIKGRVEDGYMMDGDTVLDFHYVKTEFRLHLNNYYDHRLLLNENDPWAQLAEVFVRNPDGRFNKDSFTDHLPGLQVMPGDPTTENIALWIFEFMRERFSFSEAKVANVFVDETKTNGASCGLASI
jgi:6-pyruvoyltetrahydropterin/6-carboxytetrahydropterin synthase